MKNKVNIKTFLFISLLILISIFAIERIYKNEEIRLKIFSRNPEINEEQAITLISTGDIGLVRDVNNKILQNRDSNYPFLKIADYLRDADLTVTNLEGPLIKDCPIILEGFTFCGESTNVKGLTYAGIDAANLANNHTTNYGLDGLGQTKNTLESNDIAAFGIENQIRYLQVGNKKVALVGFVELGDNWGGLNNATVENIKRLNQEARENADIVIDAFHWGVEYTYSPSENQKILAHTAVDSGGDIVLGNHPHWIQPIEIYKNKYIIYAQGNTIFDQDWSRETREGVIYKFVYENGEFKKIDEKYTIIENNSQPRFATSEESKEIIRKVSGGLQ